MEKLECEEMFETSETVPFKIDKKEYGYKKPNGATQNSWLNEYMEIKTINQTEENLKGEQVYIKNIEKYNNCIIKNVVKVPFSAELIQKILKLEKPTAWEKLTSDQRVRMLGEFKGDFFTELIIQINQLGKKHEEQKKN